MKKLDSYVLKELVLPFLVGTVAVVLMFQANMLIFQLKTFSVSSVPLTATLQTILYSTPGFLRMTLPVGTSLAAALAISRLARESELNAMRIAGAPLLRICIPVAFFGLAVAAGNFWISEKVMPVTEVGARKIMQQVGLLGVMPDFKSNVVINLPNYSANIGSVSKTNDNTLRLYDVILFERPDADVISVIRAKTGEYKDGVWTFHGTKYWWFKGDSVVDFKSGKPVVINDPITISDFFTTELDTESNAATLAQSIAERKKTGVDSTWAQVLYHTHFSIPASSIIFAFVSPVFAVLFARSGSYMGLFLSILICGLYYNAHIVCTEVLGRHGWLSPVLAAWAPNILFLALGVLAVRRLE
ncbi:MAG: LptF/LptG family permease [Armatimonadetes bacterium]|nr:LptF/LptG family permease [Armatimonadota bacterium]